MVVFVDFMLKTRLGEKYGLLRFSNPVNSATKFRQILNSSFDNFNAYLNIDLPYRISGTRNTGVTHNCVTHNCVVFADIQKNFKKMSIFLGKMEENFRPPECPDFGLER